VLPFGNGLHLYAEEAGKLRLTYFALCAQSSYILTDRGHIAFVFFHISHLIYIVSYGLRQNNNAYGDGV
jgi:hypothetical protein